MFSIVFSASPHVLMDYLVMDYLVTLQGKFRFWDSKFREMKNRSVESVEKDRRLFHPSHSQNDDGDNE